MSEDQPTHRQDIKPVSTPEVEEVIDPAQELFQDPELFVEKYLDRIEEEKQEGKMRYKLIEFKPKTPEIAQLIKDLQFFMFGGNGNTAREAREFPELIEDETTQWNKLHETLEQHPEQALKDIKKALLLLSSLLKKVAGVDLKNCFSHTLFGERYSQRLRKGIETGGINAEDHTALALQNEPRQLWATSQLSPYTPWAGQIFMSKRRIIENTDNDETKTDQDRKLEPKKKGTIDFAKGKGLLRVEMIRRLQRIVWQENNQLFGVSEDGLNANDARSVIANGEDKIIDTGNADEGWMLKPNCDKLYKTVDAALVTGKEFFEEGRIRFIVPEHDS